jgi:hypothetical protein
MVRSVENERKTETEGELTVHTLEITREMPKSVTISAKQAIN